MHLQLNCGIKIILYVWSFAVAGLRMWNMLLALLFMLDNYTCFRHICLPASV